jgi:hypothetical protein
VSRGGIVRRLTKHGGSRFIARWECRDPAGTRRQYSKTFSTKGDAQQFLAMRLAESSKEPRPEAIVT